MIPSGFISRIPLLLPPSSCSSILWAIWPRMSVGISPTLQEFVQRFHNKDSPRKPLKITWKSVHGRSLKFYLSFFPIIHSRNSSTDFSRDFSRNLCKYSCTDCTMHYIKNFSTNSSKDCCKSSHKKSSLNIRATTVNALLVFCTSGFFLNNCTRFFFQRILF